MARPGYKGITLKESTVHTLSEITKKLAEANATLSDGKTFVESIPETILYLTEQFVKYEGLNTGIQTLQEPHKELAEIPSAPKEETN